MRFIFFILAALSIHSSAAVRFERVPGNGVQPQVLTDVTGRMHLLYFKGDGVGGDLFYSTRSAGSGAFREPIRVNKRDGSVIVAGTMRGPQMTLGQNGRVHVVWMGGNGAEKVEVGGEKVTPLLYTRSKEGGDGFEPERNILTHIAGLDGGQSVAADQKGNVYVVWHGAAPGVEGEEQRGLYVARSTDNGKTFAREFKASVPKKGACACCGIRAQVDGSGALHVLFRAAEEGVNRSELWLKSTDFGKTFQVLQDDPWKTATCPASSAFMRVAKDASDVSVGAWETDNRVIGAILKGRDKVHLRIEGNGKQKHPTLAVNERGEVLLTWVEGQSWGGEGTLVCQVFDSNGKKIGETIRKSKLPAWSFGAPYVGADGEFVVLY